MGDHVACQTDLLIGDATMTMMHSFLPAGCGKDVFYITPSGRVFATFPTLSSSCTLPLTFAEESISSSGETLIDLAAIGLPESGILHVRKAPFLALSTLL